MTRSAQAVLGVLRQADEHELQAWEIAPLARLSIGQTRAACRDLCSLGLLVRRRDERQSLFRVNRRAFQEGMAA